VDKDKRLLLQDLRAFNAKVVIMDEPTAALAIKEVGKVLDLINGLKKTGVGVIVISHRDGMIYLQFVIELWLYSKELILQKLNLIILQEMRLSVG